MFLKKKSTPNIEDEKRFDYQHSYERLIKLVNRYLDTYSQDDAVYILDYLISSILDDICTSVIVEPLITIPSGILPQPFPDHYFDENNKRHEIYTGNIRNVDLSKSYIYVRPWNTEKTMNNLIKLMKKDFEYKDDNHFSFYFSDIDLCYVHNGNHSINAGRYLKKGEILSDELDLTLLYPHYNTDGAFWYNSHTGEKTEKVSDFRFAAVFTMASIRYDLKSKS